MSLMIIYKGASREWYGGGVKTTGVFSSGNDIHVKNVKEDMTA